MQRPIRIPIFGIICLIFGGFILLHNLGQLYTTTAGPDAVQVPPSNESAGQIAQSMRVSALAMQDALREPVYRIGMGIKSVLSLLMVGMLIAAGGGLLRNQPWSIRLAKIWSLYAILTTIVVTALQSIYLIPKMQVPSAMPGTDVAMYIGMVVVLLLLCILPVLLLLVLPSRNVVAYLRHKSAGQPMPAPQPAAAAPSTTTPTPTKPAPPTPQPSAAEQTWRDDPWNDPNSQ